METSLIMIHVDRISQCYKLYLKGLLKQVEQGRSCFSCHANASDRLSEWYFPFKDKINIFLFLLSINKIYQKYGNIRGDYSFKILF